MRWMTQLGRLKARRSEARWAKMHNPNLLEEVHWSVWLGSGHSTQSTHSERLAPVNFCSRGSSRCKDSFTVSELSRQMVDQSRQACSASPDQLRPTPISNSFCVSKTAVVALLAVASAQTSRTNSGCSMKWGPPTMIPIAGLRDFWRIDETQLINSFSAANA